MLKLCKQCGTMKHIDDGDICRKCLMPKRLEDCTRKELIAKCQSYIGICAHQQNSLIQKQMQIKHFRMRLKKIRDGISYLLEHPYSNGVSIKTRR